MTRCACGAELAPYAGRGRPRVRCAPCAANRSALNKDYRAAHPGYVRGYNAGRRVRYSELRKRRGPSPAKIEAHNARLREDAARVRRGRGFAS
ncbi:MAG TPA: hypothetical protein VGU71_04185 [Candidatus Dormibacteraeota bacterium]|nr:hypothetical protein [Candidatus Dormibacteraeota bacterium]